MPNSVGTMATMNATNKIGQETGRSSLLPEHPPHRFDGSDRQNVNLEDILQGGQDADYQGIHGIQRGYTVPHMPQVQHPISRRAEQPAQALAEQRYPTAKPAVGSEEWYKVRKDNHKEVERRRRETINKGIEDLAQVVPDCDKHKGQILSKAVEYIKKLKENEQQYMEKLTLEKLLAEQAIAELSNSNKTLKNELAQAWKEVEHWKRQAVKND